MKKSVVRRHSSLLLVVTVVTTKRDVDKAGKEGDGTACIDVFGTNANVVVLCIRIGVVSNILAPI
jgi:hypothetical protein